jgi:hypothetical protein
MFCRLLYVLVLLLPLNVYCQIDTTSFSGYSWQEFTGLFKAESSEFDNNGFAYKINYQSNSSLTDGQLIIDEKGRKFSIIWGDKPGWKCKILRRERQRNLKSKKYGKFEKTVYHGRLLEQKQMINEYIVDVPQFAEDLARACELEVIKTKANQHYYTFRFQRRFDPSYANHKLWNYLYSFNIKQNPVPPTLTK